MNITEVPEEDERNCYKKQKCKNTGIFLFVDDVHYFTSIHFWEREDLKMEEEQEAPRWQDLPEECWELVFDRLKYHHHDQDLRRDRHFESVSLVCKQFLSISNRLRSSLTITDPLIPLSGFPTTLTVLLRRFRHLNRINLDEFHGDLDHILTQLAHSGLNHLQALDISNQRKFPEKGIKKLGGSKMKNSLKILICAGLEVLLSKDLVAIGDSLPYLEELDISFPKQNFRYPPRLLLVNDAGIVNLSSKLLNLRKINISGIQGIVLYSSLLAISSNCVFLTHITADNSIFLKEGDISSLFYITRHLISLTVKGILLISSSNYYFPPPKTIESSLISSRDLCVLDFSHMIISDEFLLSVREADFPLKKLALSCCRGFTINGIGSFLCAYRSLKHLDLQGTDFLTDQSVSDLSEYMHDLNFIGLDSCSQLTSSTFFTLARNCPCLQEIRMEATSLGENDFPTEFLGKNLAIRVLKFACNTLLNDKTLEKIGSVCPKLESLDVSRCMGITEHGIHEIGKRCSEIRELKMVGCKRICDFLVTNNSSEFSKLEDLNAMSSRISDGGLSRVGYNCIGLQRLVLECCFEVTEKGVIEVVKKCKRLRELNLKNCSMTIVASLNLIVFSRPSLRKIIPPGGFIPGKNHKDLFLRHGCMVCDG